MKRYICKIYIFILILLISGVVRYGAESENNVMDAISSATIHFNKNNVYDGQGKFNINGLIKYQEKMIQKDRDKQVYIVRNADPEKAAYDLIKKLDPIIGDKLSVLIKPNISGFSWFKKGADNGINGRVTDIRFVEGLVKYLEERKVYKIIIAEGWGVDDPKLMQKLFVEAGYSDLIKRHPLVELVDLNYYGGKGPNDTISIPVKVVIPGAAELKTGLMVPKIYLEHVMNGLVINVPKMKTHRFSVISTGMKNLMGIIGFEGDGFPHTNKWKMHAELKKYLKERVNMPVLQQRETNLKLLDFFSDRLCDVYSVLRPHMTLIDGVLAAEGDGFNKISSVPLCIAVGSYNTIYADIAAASYAGYFNNSELKEKLGTESPPYLTKANDRFYKNINLPDDIKINGDLSLLKSKINLELISLENFTIKGDTDKKLSGGDTIPAHYLGKHYGDPEQFFINWPVEKTLWITKKWNDTRLPPGVATGFWCGYTDDELLIFFISYYRDLEIDKADPLDKEIKDLFKRDVVEVFIDTDPLTPQTYYEFEFSPGGGRLDLAVDLKKPDYNISWNSGFSGISTIQKDKNIWYSLLKIPFDKIGKPVRGSKWKANFFRVEGEEENRVYSAWQPTMTEKPAFHVPQVFGYIRFDK